jgi:hypothetical protein
MKKVKVGKHILEIYDSIDELPVLRFHKYNKMLLIDSGVGSDLNDVNNHVERAMIYLKTNPDLAIKELDNLRQAMFLIMSEVSPNHLAFCTLVKSIDGKPFDDLSDEGLKEMLVKIKDISHTEITAQMEAVKKKIDNELNLYFPSSFEDVTIKEYFDQLKKRTILVLDSIITGESKEREIQKITELLITYTKPHSFNGSNSVEIKHDKEFEDMCLLLSEKLHIDLKKFTVLEYYNAFEYLKKKLKWKKTP